MVFSNKNSVVLYPSEEETRFFETNYQEEFKSRELGKIIVNEVDELLNRFSEKLPKVDANQNFKSEYEFKKTNYCKGGINSSGRKFEASAYRTSKIRL